jgi:hypothetical protein
MVSFKGNSGCWAGVSSFSKVNNILPLIEDGAIGPEEAREVLPDADRLIRRVQNMALSSTQFSGIEISPYVKKLRRKALSGSGTLMAAGAV